MLKNISLATRVVTERNRELVAQGLCVKGKKKDLSGKLMLIDALFHASIFQETQSPLTDDGRIGRLGVAGVHRGYLRHLERKMGAHTVLTLQSLSLAH